MGERIQIHPKRLALNGHKSRASGKPVEHDRPGHRYTAQTDGQFADSRPGLETTDIFAGGTTDDRGPAIVIRATETFVVPALSCL